MASCHAADAAAVDAVVADISALRRRVQELRGTEATEALAEAEVALAARRLDAKEEVVAEVRRRFFEAGVPKDALRELLNALPLPAKRSLEKSMRRAAAPAAAPAAETSSSSSSSRMARFLWTCAIAGGGW